MATIEFMPDRLNAEPVVFRGFTTPELGFTALFSVLGGLVVAIPVVPFLGWIAFPTVALLMPLVTVIFGGRLMACFKRGKPENYLYRRLDLQVSQFGLGTKGLVLKSQTLALRRLRRVYSRPHGVIFSAMQTLLLQNKPIDLITLAESMEQQGTLEQCGGFAYLAELSKNTPSAANIVAYAEYVASYGQKRQLLALGHDLVGQASDARIDLMVLLDDAERRIFAIAEQQSPDGDVDLPASLETFLERLEQRCGSEDLITGTPTGFTQLNDMTSGFQSSDLILLAGRPSMGKTALGLAFCEGALNERPDMAVQVHPGVKRGRPERKVYPPTLLLAATTAVLT